MLMGFMTYEAYVNFLGVKLQPELWENERTTFRTAPYKGTNGKLLKLCELHNIPFPDKDRRPFQSVTTLNSLRDLVAHGKPEEFELKVRHAQGSNPALIKSSLDNFVSGEKAERAIADLKELIESLHAAFVAEEGIDLLLPLALDGSLAMSIGHMGE